MPFRNKGAFYLIHREMMENVIIAFIIFFQGNSQSRKFAIPQNVNPLSSFPSNFDPEKQMRGQNWDHHS
jgi:hypothetical protein